MNEVLRGIKTTSIIMGILMIVIGVSHGIVKLFEFNEIVGGCVVLVISVVLMSYLIGCGKR